MRRAAYRGGEVAREGKMRHLLNGNRDDRVPPARHGKRLCGRQSVALAALQAPCCVEVAAHQVVLDRRRLGEEIDQLLAGLDPDFRFFMRHVSVGLPKENILTQGRPGRHCRAWKRPGEGNISPLRLLSNRFLASGRVCSWGRKIPLEERSRWL